MQDIKVSARFGWRYAATTRAKESQLPEPNDDAWLVRFGQEHLDMALVDVATHKRGITGLQIQEIIGKTFNEMSFHATPSEIIAETHVRLANELSLRQANGVACLLIVRLARNGNCQWAHVGDAVLLRWQAPNLWRRSKLDLLNTRHRRGQGLTQSVGTQSKNGPCIEEGSFVAGRGDKLLLASDGVFHDAIQLKTIKTWVDTHHQYRELALQSDLVRKVETEARLSQPHPDDSTLILIEREWRNQNAE